jgi:hypothetical protein
MDGHPTKVFVSAVLESAPESASNLAGICSQPDPARGEFLLKKDDVAPDLTPSHKCFFDITAGGEPLGRGLHSSTFQLNLSSF